MTKHDSPLRNLSGANYAELAKLPIIPDPTCKRGLVKRAPVANPEPGGPTHALICHPDAERELRAALAAKVKP